MKKFITNCTVVTDGKEISGVGIVTDGGKIVDLCEKAPEGCEVIDLGGKYIAPGFIELHAHGGGGAELIDGTDEAFDTVCHFHESHGTAVFYPTLSASDNSTILGFLDALRRNKDKYTMELPGAHLEGPYLNPEMCGAQDTGVIRKPDEAEYTALISEYGDIIARWSYAPENDEDGKFARYLKDHGILSATAHSAAEYSHMIAALENGNRLVTHLYSCTSTVTRHGGFRHLGVIETAYLMDDIYVEAIADGCHIPPELMRMIVKLKGTDRVCLITDAIRFAGVGAGTHDGNVPYLIEDGVAKLLDRSAFAGSIASSDVLLRRTVAAGIPMPDVVKMMTETPAKVMGLFTKGRIAKGFDALFTVFDGDYNASVLKA